ncbi:MAG: iron-sulfur cluster assembly scaffold protein, partial [Chloroflexi bacterium]
GLLPNPDFDHEEHNPLCGDQLHLTLHIDENGVIQEVGWEGDGCAISQASASMLGEELIGKTLEEAKSITKQDIFDMLGIPLSANRVKCALLSLKVLNVGAYGQGFWEMREDEEDE